MTSYHLILIPEPTQILGNTVESEVTTVSDLLITSSTIAMSTKPYSNLRTTATSGTKSRVELEVITGMDTMGVRRTIETGGIEVPWLSTTLGVITVTPSDSQCSNTSKSNWIHDIAAYQTAQRSDRRASSTRLTHGAT